MTQKDRVSEFLEKVLDSNLPMEEQGLIINLSDENVEGGGYSNGGSCTNSTPGACGSNGGSCTNYGSICNGGVNRKDCVNVPDPDKPLTVFTCPE